MFSGESRLCGQSRALLIHRKHGPNISLRKSPPSSPSAKPPPRWRRLFAPLRCVCEQGALNWDLWGNRISLFVLHARFFGRFAPSRMTRGFFANVDSARHSERSEVLRGSFSEPSKTKCAVRCIGDLRRDFM